jgi:membrane protease YdiL (CAAX protease family)
MTGDNLSESGRPPRSAAALARALAAWALVALAALAARRGAGPWGRPLLAAGLFLAPLACWGPREWGEALRVRPRPALAGILEGLAVTLAVIPLFLAAVWLLGQWHPAGAAWRELGFRAPAELALVAVPEEFFFRSFLQRELEKAPRGKVRVLGAECGAGLPAAAALFALAHALAAGNPRGLLVFFPGLAFGWLYARRQSLAGPAVFHAGCNLSLLACPGWL